MKHSHMYKGYNDERFRDTGQVKAEDLYTAYGTLSEDALYQQKHHLESIKNPSSVTFEKINYIKRRLIQLKSRRFED